MITLIIRRQGSDLTLEFINRPLVQRLVDFNDTYPVSFHVPGHKSGALSGLPAMLRSALTFDYTELNGLDDLHQPKDVIKEAQEKLANVYHADASFFLVNGSTVGNLAMVYATCRVGDRVIVQRNAHKSVFNALELVGARPILVNPYWDEQSKSAGTVTEEQVKHALKNYPEAKAVILTSPTYYGTMGDDLQEIISICHEAKIPVLVDEAHGAHFVIGEPFPKSALEMGADVVVHSAHKTLPAMTMGSFLHVKSKIVSHETIARYLQMLQSSSPSYLLMASLDDARAYAETFTEEDVKSFLDKREMVINRLSRIPELQIIESKDPLKLMVRTENYSGFQLLKALEMEDVYAELADPYQVLFILPLFKKEHPYEFEEIAKRIEKAIGHLHTFEKQVSHIGQPMNVKYLSVLSYNESELKHFKKDWLPFEKSVGKVAAASVIPYPPGIPLVLLGERITKEHVDMLSTLIEMEASFQGTIRLKEKQIFVVINEE